MEKRLKVQKADRLEEIKGYWEKHGIDSIDVAWLINEVERLREKVRIWDAHDSVRKQQLAERDATIATLREALFKAHNLVSWGIQADRDKNWYESAEDFLSECDKALATEAPQ